MFHSWFGIANFAAEPLYNSFTVHNIFLSFWLLANKCGNLERLLLSWISTLETLFFFHVLTSVTFCMVSFQQALSISPHLTQRDISSQSEYYLHRLSYSSPKQNELTTQNFCITSSNDIFLFSILRSNNL